MSRGLPGRKGDFRELDISGSELGGLDPSFWMWVFVISRLLSVIQLNSVPSSDLFFFLTWTIFKVFIESVTILLLFYVLVFRPCGILAPRPEMEPMLPALEGEVLITGLPGKSPQISFMHSCFLLWIEILRDFICAICFHSQRPS